MNTITINTEHFEPVTPSESDVRIAGKTSQRLAAILRKQPVFPIQLLETGQPEERLELPTAAVPLLVALLAEMAKGHAVTLVPIKEEITTQQAADLLNVSRPFFVQMLDNGVIPFRKVGARRRVKLQDVINYKRDLYNKRLQTLNDLTVYDQELGLQ